MLPIARGVDTNAPRHPTSSFVAMLLLLPSGTGRQYDWDLEGSIIEDFSRVRPLLRGRAGYGVPYERAGMWMGGEGSTNAIAYSVCEMGRESGKHFELLITIFMVLECMCTMRLDRAESEVWHRRSRHNLLNF